MVMVSGRLCAAVLRIRLRGRSVSCLAWSPVECRMCGGDLRVCRLWGRSDQPPPPYAPGWRLQVMVLFQREGFPRMRVSRFVGSRPGSAHRAPPSDARVVAARCLSGPVNLAIDPRMPGWHDADLVVESRSPIHPRWYRFSSFFSWVVRGHLCLLRYGPVVPARQFSASRRTGEGSRVRCCAGSRLVGSAEGLLGLSPVRLAGRFGHLPRSWPP